MPLILATQKAEIRRFAVRGQSQQIVHETLSQKKPFTKIGLVEWLKVEQYSPHQKKKSQKVKARRLETLIWKIVFEGMGLTSEISWVCLYDGIL
jgi:hypothetical protein